MLLPSRAWVAVGAAAFVAFLPQNVAILASVNNDALGWALIAVTLLVTVNYLTAKTPSSPREDRERTQKVEDHTQTGVIIGLGVLVGLIFVTKATGYLMAGVVVLAIYLKHRASLSPDPLAGLRGPTAMVRDTLAQALRTNPFVTVTNLFEGLTIAVPYWLKRQFRQPLPLLKAWTLFLVPALLIGSLWWVRNFGVYGVPDFLGLRAHDHVVVGQARTAEYIAQYGEGKYLTDLVQTTFTSFWGQFGWMALPLNGWLLWVAQGLTLAAVGGWVVKFILNRRESENTEERQERQTKQAWIVIAAAGVLAIAAYAYYNSEFLQFQARYMYAGLIPFALVFTLGLEEWAGLIVRIIQWLTAKTPTLGTTFTTSPEEKEFTTETQRNSVMRQVVYWVITVVPLMMLAPFCVYLLWKVIVPNLAP
jgi:hypothetical protein